MRHAGPCLSWPTASTGPAARLNGNSSRLPSDFVYPPAIPPAGGAPAASPVMAWVPSAFTMLWRRRDSAAQARRRWSGPSTARPDQCPVSLSSMKRCSNSGHDYAGTTRDAAGGDPGEPSAPALFLES